jgi:DNA-binding XRE family transcriptional regulator
MDARLDKHPKILNVAATGALRLRVDWDNGISHEVDLAGMTAEFSAMAPLGSDPELFGRVEPGDFGWCAHWTDDVEVSAATLWALALRQDGGAFRAWRRRHGMSQQSAAEALGLSTRMVKYYEAGTHAVPKTIRLAIMGYDSLNAAE